MRCEGGGGGWGTVTGRGHVPLDDFRDLRLPVGDRLLLGCQILQLVLQLPILSRELIHKGTQLEENSRDTRLNTRLHVMSALQTAGSFERSSHFLSPS